VTKIRHLDAHAVDWSDNHVGLTSFPRRMASLLHGCVVSTITLTGIIFAHPVVLIFRVIYASRTSTAAFDLLSC